MRLFDKNKPQPSLPDSFKASGENESERQSARRLPVRHSLVIPDSQTQQPIYSYLNEPPAHQFQQQQQQQQQQYDDNYTHSAHAATRSSHRLPDSPLTSSYQQAGGSTSNFTPTSPSDLGSTGPFYAPPISEPVLLEAQRRKIRKSLFGLTPKEKHKDKDSSFRSSKVLGRTISVRRKIPGQISPNPQNLNGHPVDLELEYKEEQSIGSRMPLQSRKPPPGASPYSSTINRSSSNIDSEPFDPPRLQRVSTAPLSQEFFQRQSQGHQYQDELRHSGIPHPQLQVDQAHLQEPGANYQLGGPQAFADQVPSARSQSPQLDPHHTPRPPSQQSFGPPSPLNPHYQGFESNQYKSHSRQSLQPPTGTISGQSGMDRQTGLRQSTESMPSGHDSHSQTGPPPNAAPGSNFKGNLPQPGSEEPDRDTPPPPPAKGRDDTSDIDVRTLIQKHEELQAKYIKVKRYYFEKEAQVQQLQNTVAHQRMSTSRTVLDDGEYSTRFGRLDGAINNLAFNIRKDWKSVPPWLQAVVNEDAHLVGTKEMTAVGRACLTRWLVDEIFHRYFHPSLEPNLSRHLKVIERNVRRMGKAASEEEKENHLAKLTAWRRTTLDGLGEVLQGKLAEDHRTHLTATLVEKLTASLEMNLKEPAPPGLENGVAMIVELAIGIAANMPLESRDVIVEYFLPGAPITESHMKLETTLPPLANPGCESRQSSEPSSAVTDRGDQASLKELGIEGPLGDGDAAKDVSSSAANSGHSFKESRKKSVFGSLIYKKPHPNANQSPSDSGRPGSAMLPDGKERDEFDKEETMRIRFAAFVAVEVQGKGAGNVIVKAPVYGLV
ncbi:hypothetical protein PRK78_007494 [Emydomyces testavorans]|uniref:Uncharacterized protein n=1 Tax=Emydomyces testavorans TaxID=2070801 RepID=A0AAF0IQM3_9EURO|nr:hypothetical protein PRK78_007494 [Emydomyces testavorans]